MSSSIFSTLIYVAPNDSTILGSLYSYASALPCDYFKTFEEPRMSPGNELLVLLDPMHLNIDIAPSLSNNLQLFVHISVEPIAHSRVSNSHLIFFT